MSKKKKVRVAFKKNRQNRTRANDLTRRYHADDLSKAEPTSSERVRAKGDLSRHRTIMTDAPTAESSPDSSSEDVASMRSLDLDSCLQARVIRIHGILTVVETEDGKTYPCRVRRLLKTLAIDGRNVVTIGDRVWFRPGRRRLTRG